MASQRLVGKRRGEMRELNSPCTRCSTCSTASRVAWSVERLPGSHTTAAAASATAMLSSGAVRPRGSTLTSAVHLQQNKR